jgi:hypothetical protein
MIRKPGVRDFYIGKRIILFLEICINVNEILALAVLIM